MRTDEDDVVMLVPLMSCDCEYRFVVTVLVRFVIGVRVLLV